MWFSVELVLSKVSFLSYWPFLHLLLPICLLPSLRVMYSSCKIPLSASFISLFSTTCLRRDKPFPLFPLFPFTDFSFPFSNFCPFFPPLSLYFPSCWSLPQHPSHFYICLLISPSSSLIFTSPCSLTPHVFHLSILFFFSSSPSPSSIGWLSLRSLPWSLRQRCTTTSTRGPQTTSTFRQGNGS